MHTRFKRTDDHNQGPDTNKRITNQEEEINYLWHPEIPNWAHTKKLYKLDLPEAILAINAHQMGFITGTVLLRCLRYPRQASSSSTHLVVEDMSTTVGRTDTDMLEIL